MIFYLNVHAKLYKMNEIVNNLLLAGDKFMPEMHLKQPGYTYIACGPFSKNKDRIPKFIETGDTNYIYKNELFINIIRKFQKRKVYSEFKDVQLISKFNKRFRFLLCVIDIFSKYAWVVPLKDKKRCYYR